MELIHAAYGLKHDTSAMVGVSRRECVEMLAHGKENELLDTIYRRYESYASQKQMMLVEGTHSGKSSFSSSAGLHWADFLKSLH